MTVSFHTVSKEYQEQIKEKGSTFVAYLFPVADESHFKKRLEELKTEFKDATHHCYAFRVDPDGILLRSSDDGEPSGTAGKPIMGQIQSFGLSHVGIVVVRYYGGTKLGTGGLIKAYREAAKKVLESAEIIEKKVIAPFQIIFTHENSGKVNRVLKDFQVEVLEKGGDEKLIWNIAIEIDQIETCKENLLLNGVEKITHLEL